MSLITRDFDQAGQAQPESVAGMLRRLCFLALQVFFLVMLSVFPFKFLHIADVRPNFLLMAVYYWAVFAPQQLSPLSAFVTGLVIDLLYGGPLGLNAVTLLIVQRLTARQRKVLSGQSFPVLWLGFALVTALAFGAQWAIFSAFDGALMAVRPIVFGAALTVLFFPPVAFALGAFGRTFSRGR